MLFNNGVVQQCNGRLANLQQIHFTNETQSKKNNMQLVSTIFDLFKLDGSVCLGYATEAFKLFLSNTICTTDTWAKKYTQLAMYGFAMSNFFYVYDVESDNLTLQTSSLSLLRNMIMSGSLISKDTSSSEADLTKWIKQLDDSSGGTIEKSIKEGNILRTVKLELQSNGKYIGIVPRSTINISKALIVPFESVNQALVDIQSLAEHQILKVATGDKVRYVTTNETILSKMYPSAHVKTLRNGVRHNETYIYLPSLGESMYAPGLTRLDLVYLDFLGAGNYADIDKSKVNINYDKARLFLINKLGDDTLRKIQAGLNIPDEVMCNIPPAGVYEYIITTINRKFESEVFKVIMNLGYTLEEYNAFKTPVGDCYTEIEVPRSVSALRARFDNGVYKVVIKKADGKFSTSICTNCHKFLTEIYGRSYIAKYESEGIRLSKLSSLVQNTKRVLVLDSIIGWCMRLNLPKIREHFTANFLPDTVLTVEDCLGVIESHQSSVDERRTSVATPTNLLVRNCFATSERGVSRDYYKTLIPANILSMYKLSKDIEE